MRHARCVKCVSTAPYTACKTCISKTALWISKKRSEAEEEEEEREKKKLRASLEKKSPETCDACGRPASPTHEGFDFIENWRLCRRPVCMDPAAYPTLPPTRRLCFAFCQRLLPIGKAFPNASTGTDEDTCSQCLWVKSIMHSEEDEEESEKKKEKKITL